MSSWEYKYTNAKLLPFLFKTQQMKVQKGVSVFMNNLWILTLWTRARGDVSLKRCKLLTVKLWRASVVLDQLLAPGDLSPLGCRPLNAEIRWDVFNIKSCTIRYYFADRYIPLDLRELSLFCLSKTPVSKFSRRLKLERSFFLWLHQTLEQPLVSP